LSIGPGQSINREVDAEVLFGQCPATGGALRVFYQSYEAKRGVVERRVRRTRQHDTAIKLTKQF
jgi:hypothetical protein